MANKRAGAVWEKESGERIRRAREDAELGLKHLADACDVSRQAVHYWEVGKSPAPAYALIKIAEMTKADLSWLLTGNATPDDRPGGTTVAGLRTAMDIIRAARLPELGKTLNADEAVLALKSAMITTLEQQIKALMA